VLPAERFIIGEWGTAKANIDYHVDVDGDDYSIPHALREETFDIRTTRTTVEIFLRTVPIDCCARSYERGRHTTRTEHMPKAHQAQAEWSPSRLIRWAGDTIGPQTAILVDAIIAERRHPEQSYRSCLGILRLSKKYGTERLEAACARAVAVRARSYRHVDSILKTGLDRTPLPAETTTTTTATHENVRRRGYYH
jgi:transposase